MKLIQKTCMLLAVSAVPGMALAGELPNTEGMSGLQFNFSAPGARSLAMGGAFLGRADDSTAAFANPAGLTNLFSPEIAAEYRFNSFATPYTSGGVYPNVDRSTANDNVNNLSYLSFVYPMEKWVFAFYRQEFMDFKSKFNTESIDLGDGFFAFPTDNSVDVNIVNYGFSTAFRVSERVSLGASISYYDYKMNASTFRYDLVDTSTLVNQQNESGNDNSWGFTLGALFKVSEKFSVGLVYRSTPDFSTNHNQMVPDFAALDFNKAYKFEVPDAYGMGLSFQPNDNLTFNFDIMRINYSDLANPVFWAFEYPAPDFGQTIVDGMSIDDGTEYHLGAEYVLPNKPIALRAGAWYDPDHALTDYGPVDPNDPSARANASFFPGGSNETHWSVGFGFFFEKFQM
ncbi:MAG: outer membrane protein transport protein, partial [Lysobacterales bacterium]